MSEVRTMVLGEIETVIMKSVEAMLALPKLDALALVSHLHKWDATLLEIVGLDEAKGKRDVQLSYRGLAFTMSVKSAGEQRELALKSAIRGAASKAGLVKELPGEAELTAGAGPDAKGLDQHLVKKAQASRAYLERLLAEECETSGESVMVSGGCSFRNWISFPDYLGPGHGLFLFWVFFP